MKRLIRRQYNPNADVLKAQVKYLRQLPGQDASAFYRTLRDLAVKAYIDDAVRNENILTTFVEELANSVVRWEVRKGKPASVDDAVVLANEMQSYLKVHGQQPHTVPVASVNNLAGPSTSPSEMFSDLVFTIKEEVKRVPHTNVAAQNTPPAIAPTILTAFTETTKDATTMGTKANATTTMAVLTLQTDSEHCKTRVSFSSPGNGPPHKEECNH